MSETKTLQKSTKNKTRSAKPGPIFIMPALAACLCLLRPLAIYAASPGASRVHADPLSQTVSKLKGMFPPVELYVIALQEGKVLLENNPSAALRPGTELHLFREGKEFTHPITGQVLGRFEESLGEVRISELQKDFCLAETMALRKGVRVKRGDKARISASKIKLAVWPLDEGARSLTETLVYRMQRSERFTVVPTREVLNAFNQLDPNTARDEPGKAQLAALGKALGIRGLLVTKTKHPEGYEIFEAKLYSPFSGRVITKHGFPIKHRGEAPAP